MDRKRFRLSGVAAVLAVLTCMAVALAAAGVKTAKPPYLVPTAPGVLVDPILSTGDIVPEGQTPQYQMSGIPDGLGAYSNRRRNDGRERRQGRQNLASSYTVLMNHELGVTFPGQPAGVNTRISKLKIDRATNSVLSAKYVFTGTEGFERFCSATLKVIHGTPWYFTGEEAIDGIPPAPPAGHDGSSIAMNARTGQWWETEHFGHLQHENIVPTKLSKWFFLTTDDDFRAGQDAYLYAYIAKSFKAAITGNPAKGSLYVWRADDAIDSTQIHKGETLTGEFVPINQAENADSVTLKAAAAARGAFKFDRLEDAAAYRAKKGRFYFADTGKAPRTLRGRIYQFDVNRADPTQASLQVILDGDAGDDIYNPDNLDTSARSIVIQEDRESPFRGGPRTPQPTRRRQRAQSRARLRHRDRNTSVRGTGGHAGDAASRHLGVVRRHKRLPDPRCGLVVNRRPGAQHDLLAARADARPRFRDRRGRTAPGRLYPANDRPSPRGQIALRTHNQARGGARPPLAWSMPLPSRNRRAGARPGGRAPSPLRPHGPWAALRSRARRGVGSRHQPLPRLRGRRPPRSPATAS